MSHQANSENLVVSIHEERIQHNEARLADLQAQQQAHEQTDALRFDQLAQKIDNLGEKVVEKIEDVQEDVAELEHTISRHGGRLESIKVEELTNKKLKTLAWKLVWPAIAVLSGALGHHLLEIMKK